MVRLGVASAFLSFISIAGPANAADWRACEVIVCNGNACEGPASKSIILAPANLLEFGDEDAITSQLEAVAGRLFPEAQGFNYLPVCEWSTSEADALEKNKAAIGRAKVRGASEIRIADPYEVLKTKVPATAAVAAGPTTSAAKPITAAPAKAEAAPGARRPQSGEPMQFMLTMGMREPIGGENALCFSNVIAVPAPEGYRGDWPTLKNALPVIESYFPAMRQLCSKYGATDGNAVSYRADDISPVRARADMAALQARLRAKRNPEVYVPR